MRSLASRVTRRVEIAVLAAGLIVAAAAGYNAFAIARLQRLYPAPGKFYAVGGSAMHLYCTGTGAPAVILESGLGDDWLVWQKVQPELAKTTRVCSYDRAGLGWSEAQAGSRGALTIAEQLHALLRQAGIGGPFVLVGHSAGGLYARAFAGKYPAETAGLVLVDASSPEAFHALPSPAARTLMRQARHRESWERWLKDATGWRRISGGCGGSVPKGLEAYAGFARAEACRPSFENSWLGEWDDFESPADEVARLACCDGLPLVVISQDPARPQPGLDAAETAANATWNSVQEQLKRLSTRSRRVIARNSGHYVAIERPDVVIGNVRKLIDELRGETAVREYGATAVQ